MHVCVSVSFQHPLLLFDANRVFDFLRKLPTRHLDNVHG